MEVSEAELMMVLDECVGKLRTVANVDKLSEAEELFLNTFGHLSDAYWGN